MTRNFMRVILTQMSYSFIFSLLLISANALPAGIGPSVIPPTEQCIKDHVIKIGVIDTGMGYDGKGETAHLCKFGHKDFTGQNFMAPGFDTTSSIPMDFISHGTNIVGLIEKYAAPSEVKYCIVILKFYNGEETSGDKNLLNEVEAIKYATNLKLDYLNISVSGQTYSQLEAEAMKSYLDAGGRVIAAAGNESVNINIKPSYPAMSDPRVIVIGNKADGGERADSSNYGKRVNFWEHGVQQEAYGITLTGTSQATAIFTGKTIAKLKDPCYKH